MNQQNYSGLLNEGGLDQAIEVLRNHARLAILFSGDNRLEGSTLNATYHPRHWKSYEKVAEEICEALVDNGFKNVIVLRDDMRLLEQIKEHQIDLVWLNTGGMQGRNAMAHAPSILDMAGIPYIGHNPLNYALLDHKLHFKQLLRGLGLPTPDFMVWDPTRHRDRGEMFLQDFRKKLGRKPAPWIVKPVNGRGSRYIFTAETETELMAAIEEVYRLSQSPVLLESFLPGREYCVAGGPRVIKRGAHMEIRREPLAFAFMEKTLEPDELIFTSIDTCAITNKRAFLLDPHKDRTVIAELMRLCRYVCDALGLKYLIRLDVREDSKGVIHVLEANPKPDLKRPQNGVASLVAMGLDAEDLSYTDLLLSLLASNLYFSLNFRPASMPALRTLLAEKVPDLFTSAKG